MKEFTFVAVMNFKNNNLFSNYYSPIQAYVLLFCIVLNFIHFESKASIFKPIDGKNNTHYLNIQHAHHQQSPFNSKSEPTEVPTINLEEEDDFFTAQYFPEVFCFEVLPNHSNKVINKEKFIEYFHPELTVPPPKISIQKFFC